MNSSIHAHYAEIFCCCVAHSVEYSVASCYLWVEVQLA